jgi:hypothetical protein
MPFRPGRTRRPVPGIQPYDKWYSKETKDRAPPVLPKRRKSLSTQNKRAFIIPSNPPAPIEQTLSPLFAKLPAELRNTIFALVLCPPPHPIAHILHFHQRLAHIRCSSPRPHYSDNTNDDDYDDDDNEDAIVKSCPIRSGILATRAASPDSPLAALPLSTWTGAPLSSSGVCLLASCRAAYVEGVGVLYGCSVFDFAHPETARLWLRGVPRRLGAMVRRMSVGFTVQSTVMATDRLQMMSSGDAALERQVERNWTPLWVEVAERMDGLKALSVWVIGYEMDKENRQELVLVPLLVFSSRLEELNVEFRVPSWNGRTFTRWGSKTKLTPKALEMRRDILGTEIL